MDSWHGETSSVECLRSRGAVHAKVDEYGLVHGVCGAPNFDRSGTATEGQAFFLLMEAARRDLLK